MACAANPIEVTSISDTTVATSFEAALACFISDPAFLSYLQGMVIDSYLDKLAS